MMAEAWASARRVLAVRLDAFGDVLMTTPALRALKAGRPDRRLTVLASSAGAAIARLVPEIDGVLEYEAPWVKSAAPRSDTRADDTTVNRLREARFDGAVIFTVYSQSPLPAALLCFLAGIPRRLAHCRENPYQLLTDWVPDPEPAGMVRHEVRRQLDLVGAIGARTADERLSLRVPEAARRRVARLLRELGLAGQPRWLVMHPGASAPSRRYPAEAFVETGRLLARATRRPILLTGSTAESALVTEISRGIGDQARALAGRLSLAELVALLAATPLLISNNTGPVHIAAAVGTPVVDLYALTNPQHTPWAVPHRVLSHDVSCKYCYKSVCPQGHHDCLRLVKPLQVVDAALGLLDEPARAVLQ